jgi:hypothetical protein
MIVNEGFEDIYQELEDTEETPDYFDVQINSVLREALDPKLKIRNYGYEGKSMVYPPLI